MGEKKFTRVSRKPLRPGSSEAKPQVQNLSARAGDLLERCDQIE